MNRAEALRAILAASEGKAVTIATMRAVPTWHGIGGAGRLHFDNLGCMGGAASTGLGLALARPDRKVIVLDGDGSLCMQLGVLASIASEAPRNFFHFVLANGVYETSGAQAIPAKDKVDFQAIAAGAGYARAHAIADIDTLRTQLPSILGEDGPVLISLAIDQEPPSQEGPSLSRERAAHLRLALAEA